MIFEENKTIEKVGKKFGYIFSYLTFTTILFLILILLKKIPESWTYVYVMVIVVLIAITGTMIKRFLK